MVRVFCFSLRLGGARAGLPGPSENRVRFPCWKTFGPPCMAGYIGMGWGGRFVPQSALFRKAGGGPRGPPNAPELFVGLTGLCLLAHGHGRAGRGLAPDFSRAGTVSRGASRRTLKRNLISRIRGPGQRPSPPRHPELRHKPVPGRDRTVPRLPQPIPNRIPDQPKPV